MKEILDDDIIDDVNNQGDAKNTAIKYIVIMVIVTFAYSVLMSKNGNHFLSILIATGIQIFFYLILGAALRFVRIKISQWRGKENTEEVTPLWFQLFESGFAVWILFTVFTIVTTIFFGRV